jgi:hypothetical protein
MAKAKTKKGKLAIYPEITDGNILSIAIVGDPAGLRRLAKMVLDLANMDQEKAKEIPIGEREHIHLHARAQLHWHSCEVEICRADAKGTGELPDFMKL